MIPDNDEKFNNLFGKQRLGGILLHPSSLPSKYGIGDFGPNLFRFLDFLYHSKQKLWQVLPLGPTGYANSPYSSYSAFAGNPLLISPEELIKINLLSENDIPDSNNFPNNYVDFKKIIPFKFLILKLAFNNFNNGKFNTFKKEYEKFIQKNDYWIKDYSLFMSIKDIFNQKPWFEWIDDLRLRNTKIINEYKVHCQSNINFYCFTQFIFHIQWKKIKKYANSKNIKIIGDLPIFVAHDSVDVWVKPELFKLDHNRDLSFVAGVPPDYFSADGQRWGNPVYNWDQMKKKDYIWWVQRIEHNLQNFDFLRIDHFRGFAAYWQIPANEKIALNGKWISGPGIDLFITLKKKLGNLPIIAEDLGFITSDVTDLLEKTGFPGMRILQFAFDDDSELGESGTNTYLPHNYNRKTIVYTGTHDNPTTKEWYELSSKKIKKKVLEYCKSDGIDIVGDLIKLAWSSVAHMAVIPIQDLLRCGSEGRMNFPGTTANNWRWRFTWDQLSKKAGEELEFLSFIYKR